jgi:hypothetical protein
MTDGETAAELRAIRREIHSAITDLSEGQARIEKQTTATNGRVQSLELSRSKMYGVIATVGFFGPVFTAILVERLIN